jgi:hypothetical protein
MNIMARLLLLALCVCGACASITSIPNILTANALNTSVIRIYLNPIPEMVSAA